MKRKGILGCLVSLFAVVSCMDVNKNTLSQDYRKGNNIVKDTTIYGGLYNKFDGNGKRTGLWKEYDARFFEESFYHNGTLEGLYKEYFMSTERLRILAEISPAIKHSFCFLFDDSSHIIMSFNDFDYNSQSTIGVDDKYVPEYSCSCMSYFSSGNLFDYSVIGFDDSCFVGDNLVSPAYFNEDGSVSDGPADKRYFDYRLGKLLEEDVNKSDSTGLRQGLWVEDEGYVEAYYKDGALNGLYREYSKKTGTLETFGEYCHGEKVGAWFYFDDYGRFSGQKTYERNGMFNLVDITGGGS